MFFKNFFFKLPSIQKAALFKVRGNNFQPLDNVIMTKKIEKYLSNPSGLFNHARKTWRKCSKSWASPSHKHQPPKSANYSPGRTLSNIQCHILACNACCRLLNNIEMMQIDATLSGCMKQFSKFSRPGPSDRRSKKGGLRFETQFKGSPHTLALMSISRSWLNWEFEPQICINQLILFKPHE